MCIHLSNTHRLSVSEMPLFDLKNVKAQKNERTNKDCSKPFRCTDSAAQKPSKKVTFSCRFENLNTKKKMFLDISEVTFRRQKYINLNKMGQHGCVAIKLPLTNRAYDRAFPVCVANFHSLVSRRWYE